MGKKYVISISRIFFLGKTPSLHRHDLLGLHSKQSDRLTISMNAMHKIPTKMLPKKFAMTSKVSLIRKKIGIQKKVFYGSQPQFFLFEVRMSVVQI